MFTIDHTEAIFSFCRQFYNVTLLPITCFDGRTQESRSYPERFDIGSLARSQPEAFSRFRESPDYWISDSHCYYGFVQLAGADFFVVLGPVCSTPLSDRTLHQFMRELAIAPEHQSEIRDFLQQIPVISFQRFLDTLSFLHLSLNDEEVDFSRQLFTSGENKNKIGEISQKRISKAAADSYQPLPHNTYRFERQLLHLVQEGSVDRLRTYLNGAGSLNAGIMADNSLRQAKNLFIALTTLVSRTVIAGGMDLELAYQLSDTYIQDCEKSQDISYISDLSYTMLIDFSQRMSKRKIPAGMSMEVFEAMQFISRNVCEPIRVGDVAEAIHKSRSYLTKKFKQELGFEVSSFIMRCKLEEAKSLLTYTDKSLSEISSYLCFSSQAYFQNVFKKQQKITPLQYRKTTQILN